MNILTDGSFDPGYFSNKLNTNKPIIKALQVSRDYESSQNSRFYKRTSLQIQFANEKRKEIRKSGLSKLPKSILDDVISRSMMTNE